MKINKKHLHIVVWLLCFIVTFTNCKKETKKEKMPNETGTVTDIEGRSYNTVKIGNQWWMAENLAVKLYNDSTPIFEVQITDNDTIWANQTTGAFCKVEANNMRYGLYYNWFAVNNIKNIAPAGWHIPSDDEWKRLEIELGMSQTDADKTAWRGSKERDKLIEKKSYAWSESVDVPVGNNESGFTGITSGCRLFNGAIGEGKSAYWWTSSLNGNEAWYRSITFNHTNIFRYHTYKAYGFSVRCVKN